MSEHAAENDRTVLRWVIPVDDQWHTPPFIGSIIHVAAREIDSVEIWTSPDAGVSRTANGTGRVLSERVAWQRGKPNERQFRVFGTGQPVEGLYHGTALVGPLVWHLFSRLATPSDTYRAADGLTGGNEHD